ncbi:MAG: hypothetical protein AB7W37_02165 [Syntrophobacteraceae bacterium]
MEWLGDGAQFMSVLQIALDIGVIVVVAIFMTKRSKQMKGAEEVAESFEKIIEETRGMAEQFDANLRERQALMQSIIAKLDQQIMEAQKTFQQLYAMRNETAASLKVKPAIPTPRLSEQQEIMQLARKGMDAEAIAKRLQKPIGEVELILNIQRLSSGR